MKKNKIPELYINGMETLPDVINMIKDIIDEGRGDSAKDYLTQLSEYLAKRDMNILELQKTGEEILNALERKAFPNREIDRFGPEEDLYETQEVLDPQQSVVDNFHEWTQKQMSNYDPVMVLMTILGQTLKIMKTTFPKNQYGEIMDKMYDSKDIIEPFTKPKLH
tara:strand:- start:12809 stop:13303 length:495 start_codon:yes stop_codon:yes gene_type:complete